MLASDDMCEGCRICASVRLSNAGGRSSCWPLHTSAFTAAPHHGGGPRRRRPRAVAARRSSSTEDQANHAPLPVARHARLLGAAPVLRRLPRQVPQAVRRRRVLRAARRVRGGGRHDRGAQRRQPVVDDEGVRYYDSSRQCLCCQELNPAATTTASAGLPYRQDGWLIFDGMV